MFKIVTFADVHLSDKNPISRIDDYRDAILNKLEQISDFCHQQKVDLAICSGDLFHVKTPVKNSHYLVSQTLQIFKSFPCPIELIYGNHDLSQDTLTTFDKQPIATLFQAGVCNQLKESYYHNNSIRVFSVDYLKSPDYPDFSRDKKDEKIQICVAHVNASSKFTDLFGERVYAYQELENASPDIFVFGHYHPDQGIEIRNRKHFINVGSLSRGSLSKDDIQRIPSFGFIKIDNDYNIESHKIGLNVLSASDIFDLEKKEKEDQEEEEMKKFIEELKDKMQVNSSDNIPDRIRSANFEKEIIDKALFYFEKVL